MINGTRIRNWQIYVLTCTYFGKAFFKNRLSYWGWATFKANGFRFISLNSLTSPKNRTISSLNPAEPISISLTSICSCDGNTFAPRTPILRLVFRIFKITFRAQLFWPKILVLWLNKYRTLLFHWLFESKLRHQQIMITCFKPHFLAQRTSIIVAKMVLFKDGNYSYFSILGYT